MTDNELLCCLIAFILGWLISRHMGNGFSVGGAGSKCIPDEASVALCVNEANFATRHGKKYRKSFSSCMLNKMTDCDVNCDNNCNENTKEKFKEFKNKVNFVMNNPPPAPTQKHTKPTAAPTTTVASTAYPCIPNEKSIDNCMPNRRDDKFDNKDKINFNECIQRKEDECKKNCGPNSNCIVNTNDNLLRIIKKTFDYEQKFKNIGDSRADSVRSQDVTESTAAPTTTVAPTAAPTTTVALIAGGDIINDQTKHSENLKCSQYWFDQCNKWKKSKVSKDQIKQTFSWFTDDSYNKCFGKSDDLRRYFSGSQCGCVYRVGTQGACVKGWYKPQDPRFIRPTPSAPPPTKAPITTTPKPITTAAPTTTTPPPTRRHTILAPPKPITTAAPTQTHKNEDQSSNISDECHNQFKNILKTAQHSIKKTSNEWDELLIHSSDEVAKNGCKLKLKAVKNRNKKSRKWIQNLVKSSADLSCMTHTNTNDINKFCDNNFEYYKNYQS